MKGDFLKRTIIFPSFDVKDKRQQKKAKCTVIWQGLQVMCFRLFLSEYLCIVHHHLTRGPQAKLS